MNRQSRIHLPARLGVSAALVAALFVAPDLPAQTAEEFAQLKELVMQMQQTIAEQNQRIAELEKADAEVTAVTAAAKSPSVLTLEKAAAGQSVSTASPVAYRRTLNDRQEAAARPMGVTLDPEYRGYIPVPNTAALMKFNVKPNVAVISDNMNAGSRHRFVPALFPLEGDPTYGGGTQSTLSANATQLRFDVRAPELDGNFRLYYQSDFFGDDAKDMRYRLQHLYGEFYGFTAGFTYGIWEDPDSWPDTVDYEGPNAVIFSRRPVLQYTQTLSDSWNITWGVEKPDIYVDVDSGGNTAAVQRTRMPDLGFNTRWEMEDLGHIQFSTTVRSLGATDDSGRDQDVIGWGVNLSTNLDLGSSDKLQFLGIYGEGVGGMGNDTSFLNSDAAFTAAGELEALPYWSIVFGLTHHWNSDWRSTVTYGHVNLDNTDGQALTFYHTSDYATANLIFQMRKHLSIGFETLYGVKDARNGETSGEHWRFQLGLVYSIFD